MLQVRVMPCLLLRNRSLVKTVKFREPAYVGDPINAIRIFNEKEVDELVFLDITATIDDKPPSFALISEIASECFMPVAYGGGVRSLEDMDRIFSLGIEKVSLNSHAVEHPEFVESAASRFGSQSIVVSIDAKRTFLGDYRVYTKGGRERTNWAPSDLALEMERRGAGEILLNSLDRDGTMSGYDLTLVRRVAGEITIPLIACGGAGSVTDFTEAVHAGASAVAAGAMVVYHGRNRAVLINFPDRRELASVVAARDPNAGPPAP